ncbi:MAG: GNAT family N-acetyltransferase [Burkholderiaceae bacterium]
MTDSKPILSETSDDAQAYRLRAPKPGDIGWVIQAHGRLYAQEYGWDQTFEALVADVASSFIKNFDARYEACWIAERDGENLGSVFLVRKDEETAQLRLLIVDPRARGLGLGNRLVAECIGFARQKGYKTLTLWTNDILVTARHIYQNAGFALINEEPHHSFGHDLIGQNWDLKL